MRKGKDDGQQGPARALGRPHPRPPAVEPNGAALGPPGARPSGRRNPCRRTCQLPSEGDFPSPLYRQGGGAATRADTRPGGSAPAAASSALVAATASGARPRRSPSTAPRRPWEVRTRRSRGSSAGPRRSGATAAKAHASLSALAREPVEEPEPRSCRGRSRGEGRGRGRPRPRPAPAHGPADGVPARGRARPPRAARAPGHRRRSPSRRCRGPSPDHPSGHLPPGGRMAGRPAARPPRCQMRPRSGDPRRGGAGRHASRSAHTSSRPCSSSSNSPEIDRTASASGSP